MCSRKLFATFVGIGVDFNEQLSDEIAPTNGCVIISVKSGAEFREFMEVSEVHFRNNLNIK